MRTRPLTAEDMELIEAARDCIRRLYDPNRHVVGAAVRTAGGKVYSAVHLEANVGRIAVCAEAVVLGKAISEGDRDFTTIVAVAHPDPQHADEEIKVVSPCGMCRELISDYSPGADVIIPLDGGVAKCNVMELLPVKYR
ncbi:MAG: cytidine deaminase [Bacillota bacterium]|nr:cytidine deaminase [Bacillota bacterium]